MSEMTLEQEIMVEVQKLDVDMQRHILEIVRGLTQLKNVLQGEPGWLFLERTSHIHIEPGDLKLMEEAIEEWCERIDDFPEVDFDD
jgi:hypothetical protein